MREDGFLVKEGWSGKYKKSIDCNNPKGFSQKAHCQGKKKRMAEESNPRIPRKKGQPAKSKKHSDLYTDEDPKGTIHGLGFKDVATAKASVAKIRKSSRKHAHKIQAAIAMEQRARVMGKTAEAAIFRKYINSMKKKTKAMNEEKKGDHEYEMIRRQTDNVMVAAKKIKKKVGKGEGDVKAWVQSKITKAADYLDTAADYMTDKEEVKEGSLRKWFKGSKSKDGKGGWVNVVTGGTCASDEPGEGTPKCVSSAKRASMSKKERLSAARRKKKADPGQQSKSGAAKPTYVSTDKPKKKKKMKEEFISLPLQLEVPQNDGEFRLGMMFRESLEQDRGMLFIFEETGQHSFHMKNTFIPLDIAFINEEGIIESIKELNPLSSIPVYPNGNIRYAIEVNRGWFAENGVVVGDAILEEGCQKCGESCDNCECECHDTITEVKDKKGKGSGTKDACYHKVKSRYSVWPSAYASGALVKCRKVGAANWGNSRKEEVEYEAKVYKTPHYRWRDALAEHHRKDEDGNTIPHEDDIKEGHYGSAVNKIPAELDKAVALHKSQAERLRKSPEFKKDAGKKANAIPGQLDKAVAMHTKQAKELRAAGVGDDKNCGCGQTPCKTYGKKKEMKEGLGGALAGLAGAGMAIGGAIKKEKDKANYKPGTGRKVDTAGTVANVIKNKGKVVTKDHYDWRSTLDEKCWAGYEKKGMKTMFGKRYPNCVKKSKSKTRKEELDYDGVIEGATDVLIKTATGKGKRKKDPNMTPDMLKRYRDNFLGASYQPEGESIDESPKKKNVTGDNIKGTMKNLDDGIDKNIHGVGKGKKIKKTLGGPDINLAHYEPEGEVIDEKKMTEKEKRKDDRLKKKYDKSDMKKNMQKQYGKEEGKKVYFATIRKQAMKEENIDEGLQSVLGKFALGALNFGKSKAGLSLLGGLGMGVGKSLPYIVAPKTMLTIAGVSAAGQGLGLAKQVARKSAADKENENIRLRRGMGESITDEALTIQDWNVDDIKFTEIETVDIIKPKPLKENMSNWRDDLGEDWQKTNRKDKTDGMSQKAVNAYKKENPGSKLKTAVTKDPKKLKKGSKSAKRRLSFCRRMKGMKKKLTSAKTSRDPDSRINKALRRWNC